MDSENVDDPKVEKLKQRLAALDAEKEKLAAEMHEAIEAKRDAGRKMFLSAIEKVKIGKMTKGDAFKIAKAIEKHGGEKCARLLDVD